jgi:phospholipase C
MRNSILRGSRRAKLAGIGLGAAALVGGSLTYASMATAGTDNSGNTATPIKHVVVLFSENISYDHYFGTYPNAANTDGIPFTAAAGTPTSENYAKTPSLLKKTSDGGTNPNSIAPYRLGYSQAWTCSQNHGYTPEQKAVAGLKTDGTDNGTGPMSTFPQNTIGGGCDTGSQAAAINMGYYDGNTATAMWNYAQNYAMSDNAWADNFGPSTVGALNVVAGQTGKAVVYDPGGDDTSPTPLKDGTTVAPGVSALSLKDGVNVGTVIGDPDPVYDDCANNDHTGTAKLAGMQGKNVGDLLSAKGVSWGWFQGGFTPTTKYNGAGTYAKCDAASYNIHGATVTDYSPHHNPFAYYKSTSNPHHLPPSSLAEVGHDGQANHQYDLSYFDAAVANGKLPAVSYVKAAAYEDGHPSNSDPIDEQRFFTRTINEIESSPEWASTAIVIAYDDSDGWYDHVAPVITNGSKTADDVQVCNTASTATNPLGGIQDRCGPSQRLPFLVISPYSKQNYIDHTKIGQSSVVKFIEDNWRLGSVGDGSFDATAGSITTMFDFAHPQNRSVLLNQNGTVASIVARTSTGGGTAPGGTTPGGSTTPHPTAKAKITTIGVLGVDKVVKAKKKIKASFLFAATGSVNGRVKLYDGKRAIASGTAKQNVAKVKFKLKKKGKHKLHLAFLGSSTVDAFTGKTFKVRAK